MLAARLRATKLHYRLDVFGGTGQVRRMLSVSGFDQLIKIIEPPAPPHMHGAEQAAA